MRGSLVDVHAHFLPDEHLHYGSDFPFTPGFVVELAAEALALPPPPPTPDLVAVPLEEDVTWRSTGAVSANPFCALGMTFPTADPVHRTTSGDLTVAR